MKARRLVVIAAAAIPIATPAIAQDTDQELAKKLANPVASLISVPLQFNYDCCYGPVGSDRVVLNVQPVIPFKLSADWNLIVRTIVPIIDQQAPVAGGGADFGIGDTTQSFFFSPTPSDGFVWAVGPVFLWPTATDAALGSHKWGAGPTALVLQQTNGWTFGMLTNHVWSYGGEGEYANVSNTLLQPFLAYNWPDTTSLTLNTESTYNWTARQWTVPVNLVLGHMVKLGGQRLNLQAGGRYYPERPHGTASWGARFVMTFLFPT